MTRGPIQLEYARPRPRQKTTFERIRATCYLVLLVMLTLGTSLFVIASTAALLAGRKPDALRVAMFGTLLAMQSSLVAWRAPRAVFRANLAMCVSMLIELVTGWWLA